MRTQPRQEPEPSTAFKVQPHDFGFKPGIDLDRMNQLVDDLETEEVARHKIKSIYLQVPDRRPPSSQETP